MNNPSDQISPSGAPSTYRAMPFEDLTGANPSGTAGLNGYDYLTQSENTALLQRTSKPTDSASHLLPPAQIEDSSKTPSTNWVGAQNWGAFANDKKNPNAPVMNVDSSGQMTMTVDNKTDGGISHRIDHAFDNKDGQAIHVEYYSRSPQHLGMSVAVLEGQAPWTASIDEHAPLSAKQDQSGWERHECDVIVPKAANGELQLHFKPDKGTGTIDIKGVKVKPNDALQSQLSAEVNPTTVQQNIDKNHTGDVEYRVVGPDGKPVAGAQVSVEQTSRPTEFGTEAEHLNPSDKSDEQKAYQDNLDKAFNSVTISVYGSMMEKNGELNPDAVKAIQEQIKWAQDNGKKIRMHPLVWDHCLPGSISSTDPQKAWEQEQAMAQKLMKQFPQVNEFIGFNEAFNNQDNAVSQHIAENRAGAVEDTMQREHAAEPGSTFIYNDYKNNDEEIAMLKQMQKDGKLPDAIGVQLHMHQGEMPVEQVQHFMDELQQFNRPIYITEMTVLSGDHGQVNDKNPPDNWNSIPQGKQRQQEYLDQLYRLLYSNPNVKGINYWDLSDTHKKAPFHNGAWGNAPGGLLNQDGSAKPAYDDLNQLINHEWRTSQTVTTADDGTADSNGQLGRYTVQVPGHHITDVDGNSAQNGDGTFVIDQTTGKKVVTIQVD